MGVRDQLFGETVVQAGLCTHTQLGECLDLQEQLRSEGKPVPRLGELLTEKKFLTAEQLAALVAGTYTRQEGRFGEVAVKLSMCFTDDVNKALQDQAGLKSEGKPHMRLGELLVETGALEPHHINAILSSMGIKVEPCPSCHEIVNLPRDAAGQDCPRCGKPMSPEQAEAAPLPDAPEAKPEDASRIAEALSKGERPPAAKAAPAPPPPQAKAVIQP
ncbi:MAG: hypothetical protein ACYTGB_12995, partial [Planctomycetota bacterium]